MKAIRVLAGIVVSLAFLVPAHSADIRTIGHSHRLDRPPGMTFTHWATNIAIDGANIIVLGKHDGGQSAFLYQRASGSSRFTYRKTLLTFPYARERLQVRMKNGIAIVHFEDRAWIFERIGSSYVLGQPEAPLRHPGGIAISGTSILFGGDNCGYDGVVYQKASDGRWRITGRLDDNQGQCVTGGLAVEIHNDTALIHVPGTPEVTTWQRNGTAIDWVSAGSMSINAEVAATSAPFALLNSTAVTPGSYVFRREGSSWVQRGRVIPADYGMGSGQARQVKYRDGVLITTEGFLPNYAPKPYVYQEIAPGQFEHVGVIGGFTHTIDFDVSGRTVVTSHHCCTTEQYAYVHVLPDPLVGPAMIPADFENGDASDFRVVSGTFAIEERGIQHNRVLAQTSPSGWSLALADASDGNYYQRIEAEITPDFGTSTGSAGVVFRYTDANNYYYMAVRSDNTTRLYRRVDGVETLLSTWGLGGPQRIKIHVDDGEIWTWFDDQYAGHFIDRSLPRGRAGLATLNAGADFDNVHIAAADETALLYKRFVPDADVPATHVGRNFSHIGGDWGYLGSYPNYLEGFQQRSPNGSAFAYIGAPVRNQEIDVAFRINEVSSTTGSWVGMLGRYVDAQTHYYAILRTYGRLEIRKKVNGVVTLLAARNHAVTAGQYHNLKFRLAEDQLQLLVDNRVVLSAHDDDIPEGAHGLATFRAAATWDHMYVTQP